MSVGDGGGICIGGQNTRGANIDVNVGLNSDDDGSNSWDTSLNNGNAVHSHCCWDCDSRSSSSHCGCSNLGCDS